MSKRAVQFAIVASFLPALAYGQEPQPSAPQECVPPPGGKCLSKEQFDEVKKALEELEEIHKSPAVLTTDDQITVVNDWDGRTYVSGGDKDPLTLRLKIGSIVERELKLTLPSVVNYRKEPDPPLFRFRLRAQVGALVPELVRRAMEDGEPDFVDFGVGFDFFHLGPVNVSGYVGVLSLGGLLGVDITKNFGISAGPVMAYQGLQISGVLGVYFAVN
jgi:hypothetical protein